MDVANVRETQNQLFPYIKPDRNDQRRHRNSLTHYTSLLKFFATHQKHKYGIRMWNEMSGNTNEWNGIRKSW